MSAPFYDALLSRKGSAATLYDTDATTVITQRTSLLFTNLKQVALLGTNRGDLVMGVLPSTQLVRAGQVLCARQGTPSDRWAVPGSVALQEKETLWFVVVKTLLRSRGALFDRGTSVALLALPYGLTVTRTVRAAPPHGSANGYGEPRTASDTTVTTRTIRCGLSNDNNPLIVQDIGNMPRGVTTAYCPLGSDVRLADALLLPDGSRLAVDQQRNLLTANGGSYALQLLLDQK